jgi:hypothetical protein
VFHNREGRVGVEYRNGRPYWYQRTRVNGRYRAEYVCPLTTSGVAMVRRNDADKAARRDAARLAVALAVAQADAMLDAGAAFDRLADRVFRVVMFLTGHRLHRRSEWRRQRGGRPVKEIQQMKQTLSRITSLLASNKPTGPEPALIRPASTDPHENAVLERAAAGDHTALPAVRKLLQNPRYVASFGAVAGMAEVALIRQAAGDNLAVAEAMKLKLEEYTDGLLADGGPHPTYAERLAGTRAAHTWLTVHILECLAARQPAGSGPAVAIDKRVTQAERRLHAALKSLAVLRRLHRPLLVAQVNVARGPMLVDNRGRAGG